MSDDAAFSAEIRAVFPEGLTGIFAIGGTRTGYILEHNQQQAEPGNISDFSHYADDILDKYFNLIAMFIDLGGQNVIITILAYDRFTNRGETYAELISKATLILLNEKAIQFYHEHNIDPYFVGIDTLLQMPIDHPAYKLGAELKAFHEFWPYRASRHKVVWEVASVPLFSFWKVQASLEQEKKEKITQILEDTNDIHAIYQLLYETYSKATYGTEIPLPHFYLGSNRNGDLKLRSLLPISLLCGGDFRLFFTPYPSLFITRETLKTIIEDLAFPKSTLRSFKLDYKDQYSSEMVEAEYQRVMELSNDPYSTIGLTRSAMPKGTD